MRPTQLAMLEHEGTRKSKDDAESHGDEEGEEEDADSVEEREDVNLLAVELRESPTSPGQFGSTEARELGTHSNMTMATASLRMDSPKMTEYSLGSTWRALKMARIVTGSVAERVDPKRRHSTIVRERPSSPRSEYR